MRKLPYLCAALALASVAAGALAASELPPHALPHGDAVRSLDQDAHRAYAAGDYAAAAAKLSEAFQKAPAPVFLLELIQTRRAMSQYKVAIRECLKLAKLFPESVEAQQALELMPQLEADYRRQREADALSVPLPKMAKENEVAPAPPAPAPVQPPSPTASVEARPTTRPPEPAQEPRPEPNAAAPKRLQGPAAPLGEARAPPETGGSATVRTAGIVTALAGVAALGAGGVFFIMAKSAQSDIVAAAKSGGKFDPAVQDRVNRNQTLELGCLALGGAALVTGTILFFAGRSGAPETLHAGVSANGALTIAWAMP